MTEIEFAVEGTNAGIDTGWLPDAAAIVHDLGFSIVTGVHHDDPAATDLVVEHTILLPIASRDVEALDHDAHHNDLRIGRRLRGERVQGTSRETCGAEAQEIGRAHV